MEAKDLDEFIKMFQSHQWEIPPEINILRNHAAEISNRIKLLIKNAMTYEDALKLAEEVKKEKIRTNEIKSLIDLAEKAKNWTEKLGQIRDNWVNLKVLKNLKNEAKNIPIQLPGYQELKLRYEKAHKW